MAREQVFVSYSHRDRSWLERLLEHLAVLERWGLVQTWSDTRIEVGAAWEREIEDTLSRSRVAVLLVSPAFLASRYIWEKEMRPIVNHSKEGMEILPLVVRPCAWQLEPELAAIQVRPANGRPLAVGSDAQVDLDLAAFVYELAAMVRNSSGHLASRARDLAEEHYADSGPGGLRELAGVTVSLKAASPGRDLTDAGWKQPGENADREEAPQQVEAWSGSYNNDYQFRLTVIKWVEQEFEGEIDYLKQETVTQVKGHREDLERARILQLPDPPESSDYVMIFKEVGFKKEGDKPVRLDGEYRAIVADGLMTGAWFSGEHRLAGFKLARDS